MSAEALLAEHLAWRPGPKAMALGPLALHVFRCLAVPGPAVYGRSSDERLFG